MRSVLRAASVVLSVGLGTALGCSEPRTEPGVAGGDPRGPLLAGAPLVRPLGIIHRRDRELSDTARRFVELLRSRVVETSVAPTNGQMLRVPQFEAQTVG